jgi:hypothetical protein
VDFLFLNESAQLIGSFLSPALLPPIRGDGNFGHVANQAGPSLIGQLADGSIDLLAFDKSGNFIASALIPNTAGLPPVVGAGDFAVPPQHSGHNTQSGGLFTGGVTSGPIDDVVTQYPNGQIVVYGFAGDFATPQGSHCGRAPSFQVRPAFRLSAMSIPRE